ncbi:alpha/beta fold hydrolase [Photobacterium sp.]|uniref:alpha/beta fold hydrolase n=1 Tax=Photobacterium sp. TaxID=660 RepID=UPI00299D0BBD|nr:alpha/beta fold hydrolase [Photobacterium sp.]MDX1301536.1 alpha/beta fold hydrolase [Photobacterium sp.]
MKTFTIDSKTMHYIDKGEGPVLVFGHSYLWDSKMWAPQLEVLSKQYRCIVPDLWSHGQSDAAPAKTRNLRDYAQDILSLMDHLEIETFSLVGLSVGGMWGAELTVLAPSRVKSLVLMDTFVGLEPEVMHKKYFDMMDMIAAAQQVPAQMVDAITPMFFARNAEQENPELVAAFRSHLASISGQHAVDLTQIGRMVFGRRDAFDDIENFALPTLIMVGAQDMPRPPLEAQLMQDAITGSELVIVPDAGHISNLEQPQFVTEKLVSFFAKVYA